MNGSVSDTIPPCQLALLMLGGPAYISEQILGVFVACLCSLMSISLLPNDLVKKLLGSQQRTASIAQSIIEDPAPNMDRSFDWAF